jgi:hypothetical protein
LKIAERSEATNAPIEPFDGCVIEGLEDRRLGAHVRAAADLTGETGKPGKLMVESSAIVAISKPAQPN